MRVTYDSVSLRILGQGEHKRVDQKFIAPPRPAFRGQAGERDFVNAILLLNGNTQCVNGPRHIIRRTNTCRIIKQVPKTNSDPFRLLSRPNGQILIPLFGIWKCDGAHGFHGAGQALKIL